MIRRIGLLMAVIGGLGLAFTLPDLFMPRTKGAPAPALLVTTPAALERIIATARARIARDAGDGEAAVLLADALMRAARVQSDASLPLEAERALRAALRHSPDDYPAARMLGAVLLSQHRFADALAIAQSLTAVRPNDPWNHGVAGDALLELGRYPEAFAAIDRMLQLRPDASGYARAAYAQELQGNLARAGELMKMAAEATGANDPEAQAWTYVQLGTIYLRQGRLDAAQREFDRAEFTYPAHPYVRGGRVRLFIARRQFAEALQELKRGPQTPETLAMSGDLLRHAGEGDAADAAYVESERLEREGWQQEEPQPAALARFLAERGRNIPEAVRLAEAAAKKRQDIHTLDALAWSYFKAGRLAEASTAIAQATRTGTRDPMIRCHAAAITASVGGGDPCEPLAVASTSHQ